MVGSGPSITNLADAQVISIDDSAISHKNDRYHKNANFLILSNGSRNVGRGPLVVTKSALHFQR